MLEIIVMFFAIVVVFILVYWLKKSLFIFGFLFKIFTFAFLALITLSIVFGYLIIQDAKDFSNNFGNSTSMFVLKDSTNGTERFLTGVILTPSNKSFDTMSETELRNTEELYKKGLISTITDQYYKVFVVDFNSFDSMNIEAIEDKNINLSKEEIRQVMFSDDAKDELAEIIADKTRYSKSEILRDINYDDEEIKSYIFSHYLSTTFKPDNIAKFLTQFKNDNIQVYEETALFKAIKALPRFLMNSVTKKIESSVNMV